MTSFLSRLAMLVCFVIGSMAGFAQNVTLTATSGTASGSFTTLKLAFDAINAGTHKGVIEIKINASTTESASASLTASAATSSSAPYYTSISIYPTTTGLSISGSLTAPLINLNGADNVTIDGRVNATGSTKSLTITNTSTSNTVGTSTIRFIADASSNTIQYCTLKGSSTAAAAGIIFFSTATTTGNDNNTITNNDITCAADASRPLNVVYALGTSAKNNDNNSISNNNIYNFLSKGTASQGINVSSYNSGFTISGNSFYETAAFAATAAVNYNVILISAATGSENGFTISGNYIGGSAASCGGTAWTKTAQNTAFTAISVTTATGTANSIQGNTIQNFNWTNAGTSDFTGIYLSGATVANIGTVTGNTIGAASGTASITYTSNTTNTDFFGINIASTDVVDCQNNIIGAITAANASTNATNFYGISKSSSAGTTTISNNTIGSTATASSINASSASSTAANVQSVYGIQSAGTGTVTISGNTIANMVNATSNATVGTAGLIGGIYVTAGTNTISNNTVRNLSIANANTSITHTASVSGIVMTSTTAAAQTVSGNTVYSLSNSNASFAGGVIGIYYSGSTTASTVSRNFIYSLTVSGATSTTADIYGIKIDAGATTYSNNIISLGGNTKTDLFGIYQTGAASNNNNIYYNTVYISGTVASSSTNVSYALYSTGILNTRDFRNNVLVNARSTGSVSSKHYAMYIAASGGTLTCDYNNYYVSGTAGVLGFFGADKSTSVIVTGQTGNDANSIATNPTFSSAGGTTAANYTPTIRGTGVAVTGTTVDYTGTTRGTNVTMGAYELKLGANEPTALSATAGVRSASITFTVPSNVGGGAITNYQYTLDNGVTWETPEPAVGAPSPLFIEGLTPCVEYSIKIRPVNATGVGTTSAAVTVTPKTGQTAVAWTTNTPAASNNWISVVYGQGLFVAVAYTGTGNRVMTSPDGITWTSRTSAADNGWQAVTYGNGLFVAVSSDGTGNRVMTSPDGITWTIRTSAADNQWKSVTYGNGIFVAVSLTGTGNRVMTSPDGITWTSRASAADNSWQAVTYGNGLFVAVSSSGTGNRVMTSPDGITWTSRTSPTEIGTWYGVTWGNGLFVAVANSYTSTIQGVMTSPDGINWTIRNSAIDPNTASIIHPWYNVTYGNGLFVAVASSSSLGVPRLMTSPNGVNWTLLTPSVNNSWLGIAFANGRFVVVGGSTGNKTLISEVGTAPDQPLLSSITPRNNYATVSFTAPSSTGYSAVSNYEYSYDNGSNWVTPSVAVTTSPIRISGLSQGTAYQIRLRAVNSAGSGCGSDMMNTTTLVPLAPGAPTGLAASTIINGAYVTFTPPANDGGADISNYQYSTDNGASWTTISPEVATSPLLISGLTSCIDYAVRLRAVNIAGVGTASDAITVTTPNGQSEGITWTSRTSAANNQWKSVAYGNGLFVAVAQSGTGNRVMTSADGITWTSRTSAADNYWMGLTYGNGLFVAVSSTGTGNRVMTSPDGITWTTRTTTTNSIWNSVVYGNGLFVAVAASAGLVMTSPDGIIWTNRTGAVDNTWTSVTYGNGLFVAVARSGTGNRVMTSPDGTTWTSRTSAADNYWQGVTFGNGLFVAVASSGTDDRVMTSPDGINWTIRTSPEDNNWESITYGNGQFVAVAAGGVSTNNVMTSPNGIDWTKRAHAGPSTWYGVAYGNGMLVAVSSGNSVMSSAGIFTPSTPTINTITTRNTTASVAFTAPVSTGSSAITRYEYSVDNGTNWVAPSQAVTTSPFTISGLTSGITYNIKLRAVNSTGSGCGSATVNATTIVPVVPQAPASVAAITTDIVNGANISFVAPTNDGGADISSYEYTINDGAAWTSIPSTSSPLSIPGLTACTEYSIKIRAVNIAGGGAASSAVSVTPQSGQLAGLNWTSRTSAADNRWTCVTYGNGLFVALSDYTSSFQSTLNGVMTSPDGINWTLRTAPSADQWQSITFGNGLFVGVGSYGIMTSPDGITWTLRSSGFNFWKSITYANGLFVVVAANRVYTSTDGITWTERTPAASNSWKSVTYGNGLFVAVSTDGTGNRVMTSPDGINWTSRTSAVNNQWNSVTFGNGLFVAVSNAATNNVMTSPDGITWTSRSGLGLSWNHVNYADGLFVVVGNTSSITGQVMTSLDGISWTARTSAANKSWTSSAYGNGIIVAVSLSSGTASQLMTSSDALAPGIPTITGVTPSSTSASLAFTAPASSGYDAISNYQYSIDNGSSWVTRSPVSTASPLVISGLTSGTNYQIKIRAVNSMGSGCGSEAASTCVNPTSGGTIAASQSGTSPFNPAAFTSGTAPSGHTGTLEYKWQSSITSSSTGFSDIASSNSDTYDAGAITQTTWYKRVARVSCKTDWTDAAESNVLEVTIISMASQPTAQPTALYFTTTGTGPSSYNFVGKFTASASATGYLVVRNTGSAPTFTPTDGTAYTPGSQTGGVIVYSGALTTFTESTVTNNSRYHYVVYAYNGSGSTTNYLTSSPLNGSALSSTSGSGSVPASAIGTGISFPGTGVTVNFPGGTPGTNLTVSKSTSAPSSNFQVNSSIRGKKPMYFTITSSSRTPGVYTLILDFSGLGPLTNAQWNSYKITKRKNSRSPWVDITKLGATIVSRYTDGVAGKFTITGLSSFSEFGLDEVYDGVLTTNLEQTPESSPLRVTTLDYGGQAFVTDGIRYDLSKLKVSISSNATDLRARLYSSTVGGNVNTSTTLTSFNTPTPLSGNVYELTPQTPLKLEPNTQYWVVFYSANNPVDIDNTSSSTETGPASFPGNYSTFSSNGGTSYDSPNTDPPALFSIEATEVTRTWTGVSSTVWSAAGNWTPSEIPGNGEIMTIPNEANDPVLDASISPANLIVESGTILNMADKNITLTQGFSNDGTLTSTTGKLILAGTSAQGIVGTGSMKNLEVNNIEGVFISGDEFMQTITGTLTPTSGILTTNGNLTLKSDGTGTARVAAGSSSGGYIDGDVITQRHLTKLTGTGRNGRAWRLVSVPVEGTGTLQDYFMGGRPGADLTISANRLAEPDALGTVVIGHNQPDVGTATGAGYDWIGVPNQVSSLRYYQQSAGSGSFASAQVPLLTTDYSSAAQGYMLFARGDRQQQYNGTGNSSTTTLQATGTLKQGTKTVTIPAVASAGYVLVGNPYMAVIDMEQVYNDNSTIIDPVVYVWDANSDGNTYKQGGYRTVTRTGLGAWTITGGAANPQYIESHAAFFVRPTAAGGTLQIKESHKVSGTPGIAPHGTSANSPARLFVNLEVTDTANRRLVDGAVVFFDKDYSEAVKDAVDIPAMSNITAGAVGLKQPGVRLAMEGRPWPTDTLQRIIPVDMRNLGDDAYVMRLIGESLTQEGFKAWLKDRHLKSETELKPDGETLYPFRRMGDVGIDSGRFEIVYRMTKSSTPGTLTPDDAAAGESSVRLYPIPAKSNDVKLSLRAMQTGIYTAEVLDMSGRVVATRIIEHRSVNGEYRVLEGRRLSPGQYIVRLMDADKQLKETLRMMVE